MAKATTLFVVEGARREVRFLESLEQELESGSRDVEVLVLPAKQDIYMLYQKLVEDDFETDVVEILREADEETRDKLDGLRRNDIDEIFLFFDFDPQRFKKIGVGGALPMIAATIEKMLEVFDNETEFGKLYISYPMIEAVYDYKRGGRLCAAYSNCRFPFEAMTDYKRDAGSNNPIASRHDLPWREILKVFVARIACLLDMGSVGFADYRNRVTPLSIYQAQKEMMGTSESVFVLSALPEFLLDYYTEEYWEENIGIESVSHEDCEQRA